MAKFTRFSTLAPLIVIPIVLLAGCRKKPTQYKSQPRVTTVVTFDGQGRRILAGSFFGDLKVGDDIKATDGVDAYLAVYDRENKVAWLKHFSGPDHQTATGVAVDKENNIVVVGTFRGDLTIEKEPRERGGLVPLKSEPGKRYGIYVAKFKPDGSLVWSRPIARQATSTQVSVAIRPDGRIAVGGNFIGFVELNGRAVIPKNSQSMFTANFGPDGTPGDYTTQTIASEIIPIWDCPHPPHEEGWWMPKQCRPHGQCVGAVCGDPVYAYCCSRYVDYPEHAWDGDCVAAAHVKC